jgi:hypothetical protein
MSTFSEIQWLVPETNMTEGRLAEVFAKLAEESWFVPPEDLGAGPSTPLFTPQRKVPAQACQMYLNFHSDYRNEEGRNDYPGTPIPEGLGILVADIEGRTFGRDQNDHVCAAEMMRVVFEGMGAVFATLGDEISFSEAVRFSQYLKVHCGLVLFSRELAGTVGLERLAQVGQVYEFPGGVQLVLSMGWTDHNPEIEELQGIWKEYNQVVDEILTTIPGFQLDDKYPPKRCGNCGWEYEGSPEICNECGESLRD